MVKKYVLSMMLVAGITTEIKTIEFCKIAGVVGLGIIGYEQAHHHITVECLGLKELHKMSFSELKTPTLFAGISALMIATAARAGSLPAIPLSDVMKHVGTAMTLSAIGTGIEGYMHYIESTKNKTDYCNEYIRKLRLFNVINKLGWCWGVQYTLVLSFAMFAQRAGWL